MDEAEEQSTKHDFPLQISGEARLSPAQTADCHSTFDGSLPITALDGQHQYLTNFSTSTFQTVTDDFGWAVFHPDLENPIPSSSDPNSGYSQGRPPSIMHGSIPGQESACLDQHGPARESINVEVDTNAIAPGLATLRKRSLASAFPIDQVERDSVQSRQKVKPDDGDDNAKTRSQLACPFQKLDPHKHHDCLKYALHRIKDVKQHIYRRHRQPEYYCARCFEIFRSADARDEHARSTNCDNREDPGFEGITEVQKNRLNARSSRSLDTEGQWFEMWDIVFPNLPRPSSAWAGSYMEEMVPLLRSLWNHKSTRILATVQKSWEKPLDLLLLEDVVATIFDCLEDEGSGTCSQNQRGLMGGQLPTSATPSRVITDPEHQIVCGEPHIIFR